MRVFKSFISVNFLEEGWDARDQYLIPVPLEAPIVVLYRKVISACRDPSHHAWRTYLELFQRLGVFNPRASLEAFLSNPPDLVLASCSNASGCHTRAHHLGTHIFVDSDYWSRFETAEDPNNSTCIALSAYTITKVAIVRGLAHCVVSQVSHSTSCFGIGLVLTSSHVFRHSAHWIGTSIVSTAPTPFNFQTVRLQK
jgi:hypothetical protein